MYSYTIAQFTGMQYRAVFRMAAVHFALWAVCTCNIKGPCGLVFTGEALHPVVTPMDTCCVLGKHMHAQLCLLN